MPTKLFLFILVLSSGEENKPIPSKTKSNHTIDAIVSMLDAGDMKNAKQAIDEWMSSSGEEPDSLFMLAHYQMFAAHQVNEKIGMVQTEDGEVALVPMSGYDPEGIDKAIATMQKAIHKAPKRLDYYMFWSHLATQINDLESILESHKAMVAAHKKYRDSLIIRDKQLPYSAERYIPEFIHNVAIELAMEQAETLLVFSTSKFPNHSWAFNALAMMADKKGDKNEALKRLLQANKADPQDTFVMMNIATFSINLGKLDTAKKFLKEIITRFPKCNEFTEAQKLYEKIKTK